MPTVSEGTNHLRYNIIGKASTLRAVWVQGEILEVNRPGPVYFTLKDDTERIEIECILFK